jgi:hypothetical protein
MLAPRAGRTGRTRQALHWCMTVWMGELCLYRLLGHGAVTLLELLSGGWVKSPEDGPGMTLVGHAGGRAAS